MSLAEALEVRGGPLQEEEVWAVLSQSAESLQDLFHKGMNGVESSGQRCFLEIVVHSHITQFPFICVAYFLIDFLHSLFCESFYFCLNKGAE